MFLRYIRKCFISLIITEVQTIITMILFLTYHISKEQKI